MQAYVMATILEHLDHEGFGTIRNALASSFATRYGQRSATDVAAAVASLQSNQTTLNSSETTLLQALTPMFQTQSRSRSSSHDSTNISLIQPPTPLQQS